MKDDMRELVNEDFARMLKRSQRARLMRGQIESGDDIAALRAFVGLTQEDFAQALGISVHTLRNWEQGRRTPEGPAIALLRLAARHPKFFREGLSGEPGSGQPGESRGDTESIRDRLARIGSTIGPPSSSPLWPKRAA
jgi:putative transcriptional regulator